ncbi:hypothetical protein CLHOM_21080 [Clostridium homopropionicum DSM 5847]|uniref:DUF6438 domain-containing protein n=1 Tax=Clostridium homopropionicum DSM 5847 TaxID=1121318 RepID=A0A0L6Z956_9CLOT|nr:DUF6438 domain-containing protein [Clostridium homopropionicum]KOA19500.1 hypothetical protein CLHOM_21080 [Clostridium homopropionicum DSM 5847]SFG80863.1 hypothetical protein SAMN04488501_1184 [Clostridium homopropionicum]
MFEYIRLQRTMCYGTCPVYSVTVDNEGNVNYHGEMFVYKSGEQHWKISKKKVEQLNDLIEDFGFKSFIYEPGEEFITDQPSCITTVKYSGEETKEIDHYYGHIMIDDSLAAFEKKIDRIIGIKKYVNPRLYIYQVEEKNSEPLIRFIVISASEKEAIYMVEKECDRQEVLEWQVRKIGIATDDYYGPAILMKNI